MFETAKFEAISGSLSDAYAKANDPKHSNSFENIFMIFFAL